MELYGFGKLEWKKRMEQSRKNQTRGTKRAESLRAAEESLTDGTLYLGKFRVENLKED